MDGGEDFVEGGKVEAEVVVAGGDRLADGDLVEFQQGGADVEGGQAEAEAEDEADADCGRFQVDLVEPGDEGEIDE
jgi:hypothetical protein